MASIMHFWILKDLFYLHERDKLYREEKRGGKGMKLEVNVTASDEEAFRPNRVYPFHELSVPNT